MTDDEKTFFEALDRLREAAGQPDVAIIVRASKRKSGQLLNRKTLHDWHQRISVPRGGENFEFYLAELLSRAKAGGKDVGAAVFYEELRKRALAAKGEAAKAAGSRRPAAAGGAPRAPRSRRRSSPGNVGVPIGSLSDPHALQVHHAISASGEAKELPGLPSYVPRDHDDGLRTVVSSARKGRSGQAFLVGDSSVGKTRSLWESIQQLPRTWQLWEPLTARDALRNLPAVAPRTVIWLNEAHRYFLAPDPDGDALAGALLEALGDQDRAPLLVLGTLWKHQLDTLIDTPRRDRNDRYPKTRLLLREPIDVPDRFTPREMRSLRRLAGQDPRLEYAVRHAEDEEVAQCLAAGPALLRRLASAGVTGKAVMSAAMDLCRVGHDRMIPRPLLEMAAAAYVTSRQWQQLDDDWFEEGLRFATRPVSGAIAPLTQWRPHPHQAAPTVPTLELADYLQQHARRHPPSRPMPATSWEAAIRHAAPADQIAMAQHAGRRQLLRTGMRLLAAAAHGPSLPAVAASALDLLDKRLADALPWIRCAASTGQYSHRQLASWYQRAGDLVSASRHYEQASDEARARYESSADDPHSGQVLVGSLMDAAEVLDDLRLHSEAMLLWQECAETADALGSPNAGRRECARSLLEHQGYHAARAFLCDNAPRGHRLVFAELAEVLQESGRLAEASDAWERAGFTGMSIFCRVEHDLAASNGIQQWLYDLADQGDSDAFTMLVRALARLGRVDEALTLCRAKGDLRLGAHALEDAGAARQALLWLQRSAETVDVTATEFAGLLHAAGETRRAIHLLTGEGATDTDRLEAATYCLHLDAYDETIALLDTLPSSSTTWELRLASHIEAGRQAEAVRLAATVLPFDTALKRPIRRSLISEAAAELDWPVLSPTELETVREAGNSSLTRTVLAGFGHLDEAIHMANCAGTWGIRSWEYEYLHRAAGRYEVADHVRKYGVDPGGDPEEEWDVPSPPCG